MKIIIPGAPIPKTRPRFRKVGNFVSVFDNQVKQKEMVQKEFLYQRPNHIPIEGVLKVVVVFYMKIPASMSKKKREALVGAYNGAGQFHSKKPDCDNMIKFYLDALNGFFFKDDSQISEIRAVKRYSENPRTEITVIPLECTAQ